MDKIEELKKLKGLLDSGLVSQEEFNSLKSEIFGDENTKEIEDNESNIKALQDKKDEILKAKAEAEKTILKERTTEKIEKSPEIEKTIVKEVPEEKVEITDKNTRKESNPKCKKCSTQISKYLNKSNKGLCIECKGKSFQIPKWTYLFLLLLIPLFWWVFKDSTSEQKPIEEQSITKQLVKNKYLTIKGNNIYARDVPKTGEVIMKLNDNYKLIVSDSCCFETIKGNSSYWYKFNHNGLDLWFFGSQTKEFIKEHQKTKTASVPDNSNYQDLKLNSVSCYEGNECSFEFINLNSKILTFDWFLEPMFAEKGSYEDIFMKEFGTGYGGATDFEKYLGKYFRVYYDRNERSPGQCVFDDNGRSCTIILNMHLQNATSSLQNNKFGYIKGTDIIIRQTPNSSSKILGSFKNSGEKVSILDQFIDESESQVLLNRDMSIQLDGENVLIKKGKALKIITKNNDGNYIVQYEDSNSENYRRLKIPINHLDFSENKWYKVKRNSGVTGWVFGKFLDLSLNKTMSTKERNN